MFFNLYSLVYALTYQEWPTHLNTNLQRTKYSYSLPVLLRVLAMEVFNTGSMPNENNVLYERSGLPGNLRWNTWLCIHHLYTNSLFKIFVSSGECLDQVPYIHHAPSWLWLHILCSSEGIQLPFVSSPFLQVM